MPPKLREGGPSDRANPVQVYVNPLEKRIIKETAKSCGLTVSAYVRAMAMGQRMKPVPNLETIRGLAQISADQRTLVAGLSLIPDPKERRALLKQIQDVQGRLVEAAKQVRT